MAASNEGTASDKRSLLFHIGLILLIVLPPVILLVEAGMVAWSWVFVGALTNGFAMGLGPRTRVGRAIGRWFRAIGIAGRALVIVAVGGSIWSGILAAEPDPVLLHSFIVGAMPAILAVEILRRC